MAVAKKEKLDWLPPGWKVEDKVKSGRKVRHYINVKSAKRLYSKSAVLCYVRNARMKNQRSQLMNGPVRRSPRNKQIPLLKEPNDSSEWLPPGWIMETRTRKSGPKAGAEYKCYTDPSTGKTFYSRPEVSRYLKTQKSAGSSGRKKNDTRVDCSVNGSTGPLTRQHSDRGQKVLQHPKSDEVKTQPAILSQHPKSDEGKTHPPILSQHPKSDEGKTKPTILSQHPKSDEGKTQPTKKRKVIVETVIDEGLPPGWIKEIRIKKSSNGVRKDPFYYDPTTGYVFRSRLEVLRYLETGEISIHAYKRKDSGGTSLQSTESRVFPSASAVTRKATEGTTKKRLFAGKGSAEGSYDRGNSKVGEKGVSAGNNVLLAPGADLDRLIPKEAQKAEGNESNTGQMYSMSGHNEDIGALNKQALPEASDIGGTQNKAVKDVAEYGNRNSRSSKRKPKGNKKERALPCRSSKRLAGIEVEPVTNSVAIERVLRSASKSSGKSETTQEGIEFEPVNNSVAIERVLQSASKNSGKSEAIPSLGSKKSGLTQGASPVNCAGSQEEIVPAASGHPKDQASKKALRRSVGDEIVKEPTKINVEGHAIKDPSRSIVENQRKEVPSRIDAKDLSMIQTSRNNIGSQMIEEPSRINLEGQMIRQPIRNSDHQMIKQRPTNNSRERLGQHPITDSQFSFPWSDPCIEFAFKTLTGAIPLDDNLAIHDYYQHQIRTSGDARDNVALLDSGPPGFCLNSSPSQFGASRQKQPTNSADATFQKTNMFGPRNHNNVTLLDSGPPGFCQNDVPLKFGASRQQQPTNSAVPQTRQSQPADATLQKTNMFGPRNHNNVTLLDSGPPGFCLNSVPLEFGTSGQQQPTNSAVPQQSQPTDANMFGPQNRNYVQHQIRTSAESSNNVTLPDAGPPGFCLNSVPLEFGASGQQQPTNSAAPQQSQPADATLEKTNMFGFQNRNYIQHQIHAPADSSNIALTDGGPPGFCLNDVQLPFGASRQQQPTNPAVPQPADATLPKNILSPQNHSFVTLTDEGPPGFFLNSVPLQFGASKQQQQTDATLQKGNIFSPQNRN